MVLYTEPADSREHLILEEKHLLWHLNASSNKSVPCNRPSGDEGEAEDSLQGCAGDERSQLLDRP